jgi:peptide/nickel transport system permease protein
MSAITSPSISKNVGMNILGAFGLLRRDKAALVSVIILTIVLLCVIFGPYFLSEKARSMNLMMRNAPPFGSKGGWLYVLGADSLGRSILARIIVASRNTIMISGIAVVSSLMIGTLLGMVAGYKDGWVSASILRIADAIMSFPSLLLAIIVLFVFDAGIANVIIVLSVSRLPMFIRTVRAEVLEIRERLYVSAAKAMGASTPHILRRHILPAIVPTLLNLAALEMAFIMLVESSLSFLGIGILPPDVSWGLMVSDGRNYIGSAWWVAFWPGLAIMLVAMALNLISNWIRTAMDPAQKWRLSAKEKTNG